MAGRYVLKFNSKYCLLSLSNQAIAPHIHLGLLLEKTKQPQKITIEAKCLLSYNSVLLKKKEGIKHEHAKMMIYLVQKLEFHGAKKITNSRFHKLNNTVNINHHHPKPNKQSKFCNLIGPSNVLNRTVSVYKI